PRRYQTLGLVLEALRTELVTRPRLPHQRHEPSRWSVHRPPECVRRTATLRERDALYRPLSHDRYFLRVHHLALACLFAMPFAYLIICERIQLRVFSVAGRGWTCHNSRSNAPN